MLGWSKTRSTTFDHYITGLFSGNHSRLGHVLRRSPREELLGSGRTSHFGPCRKQHVALSLGKISDKFDVLGAERIRVVFPKSKRCKKPLSSALKKYLNTALFAPSPNLHPSPRFAGSAEGSVTLAFDNC